MLRAWNLLRNLISTGIFSTPKLITGQQKAFMTRLNFTVLISLVSTSAFALKGMGDGRDWNKASEKDRNKFVQQTMQLNKGAYPENKMRTCIDDHYGPQVPSVQMEQDIISTAIRCDVKLKGK